MVVLLNISEEIIFFRILWLIKMSKEQRLFEIFIVI